MLAILHLLAMFVADLFKSRRRLEAENLFLRHQLNIALRLALRRCECESFRFHLSVISQSYQTWAMTQRRLNYIPVPTLTVPHQIPAGQILAHNQIVHDENTPSGARGFRGWFQERLPSRAKLVPCDCGWSGLPHYRVE